MAREKWVCITCETDKYLATVGVSTDRGGATSILADWDSRSRERVSAPSCTAWIIRDPLGLNYCPSSGGEGNQMQIERIVAGVGL